MGLNNMFRNALVFSAFTIFCSGAILVTPSFMNGSKYADDIQFFIIAIWWVPFTLLISGYNRRRCSQEGRCSKFQEE